MDFIQQLLRACGFVDDAARATYFGNMTYSFLINFYKRKAQVPQIRHLLLMTIGKITTAYLTRTLQQMSDHRSLSQEFVIAF